MTNAYPNRKRIKPARHQPSPSSQPPLSLPCQAPVEHGTRRLLRRATTSALIACVTPLHQPGDSAVDVGGQPDLA